MNRQKIIYICGLGHSGSTILDMSLGVHKSIVGLGELYTLFEKESRERHYKSLCSCGKQAVDCDFWKDFNKKVNSSDSKKVQYDSVIKLFQDKFEAGTILADSSKNSYPHLRYLDENYELKVLFLTRDYRSWSYSRHLATGKPYLYFALRWALENIKLISSLKKMGIAYKKIGYEEIALYPERMLQEIADYIGIPFNENLLIPEKTNSHIISGNIARVDRQKRTRWTYDSRWLLSSRVNLTGLLTWPLQRINRKFVYSNIRGGKISDFYLFGTAHREKMSNKFN